MLQSSIFKVSELILKQMFGMSETERAESEELITVHISFYSAVQNIKTSPCRSTHSTVLFILHTFCMVGRRSFPQKT